MSDRKKYGPTVDHSLSKVEQRLYDALSDGKHHPSEELLPLIDAQATVNNLRYYICNLRVKVRRMGPNTVLHEDGGYRIVAYVD